MPITFEEYKNYQKNPEFEKKIRTPLQSMALESAKLEKVALEIIEKNKDEEREEAVRLLNFSGALQSLNDLTDDPKKLTEQKFEMALQHAQYIMDYLSEEKNLEKLKSVNVVMPFISKGATILNKIYKVSAAEKMEEVQNEQPEVQPEKPAPEELAAYDAFKKQQLAPDFLEKIARPIQKMAVEGNKLSREATTRVIEAEEQDVITENIDMELLGLRIVDIAKLAENPAEANVEDWKRGQEDAQKVVDFLSNEKNREKIEKFSVDAGQIMSGLDAVKSFFHIVPTAAKKAHINEQRENPEQQKAPVAPKAAAPAAPKAAAAPKAPSKMTTKEVAQNLGIAEKDAPLTFEEYQAAAGKPDFSHVYKSMNGLFEQLYDMTTKFYTASDPSLFDDPTFEVDMHTISEKRNALRNLVNPKNLNAETFEENCKNADKILGILNKKGYVEKMQKLGINPMYVKACIGMLKDVFRVPGTVEPELNENVADLRIAAKEEASYEQAERLFNNAQFEPFATKVLEDMIGALKKVEVKCLPKDGNYKSGHDKTLEFQVDMGTVFSQLWSVGLLESTPKVHDSAEKYTLNLRQANNVMHILNKPGYMKQLEKYKADTHKIELGMKFLKRYYGITGEKEYEMPENEIMKPTEGVDSLDLMDRLEKVERSGEFEPKSYYSWKEQYENNPDFREKVQKLHNDIDLVTLTSYLSRPKDAVFFDSLKESLKQLYKITQPPETIHKYSTVESLDEVMRTDQAWCTGMIHAYRFKKLIEGGDNLANALMNTDMSQEDKKRFLKVVANVSEMFNLHIPNQRLLRQEGVDINGNPYKELNKYDLMGDMSKEKWFKKGSSSEFTNFRKAYEDYRRHSDYAGVQGSEYSENLRIAAEEYIVLKRGTAWKGDPNWRPLADDEKKRFEMALKIVDDLRRKNDMDEFSIDDHYRTKVRLKDGVVLGPDPKHVAKHPGVTKDSYVDGDFVVGGYYAEQKKLQEKFDKYDPKSVNMEEVKEEVMESLSKIMAAKLLYSYPVKNLTQEKKTGKINQKEYNKGMKAYHASMKNIDKQAEAVRKDKTFKKMLDNASKNMKTMAALVNMAVKGEASDLIVEYKKTGFMEKEISAHQQKTKTTEKKKSM